VTAVIEVEASAVHAPGTDLTAYQPQALDEYRAGFVMDPAEAAALDEQLRNCMRAVLKENVDYGTIPGMGDRPSLFKPGAEKLLQWFGFGFENDQASIERDADGNRIGVTYRCTVTKELRDGRKVTVSTCEGYAGYDEDKFYVSAAANERKERHNAQKYERSPNPLKFAEYRAPWNSVIKMAQKRSLVGAAIDATAAAGLFTQDLEDMRGDDGPTGEQFTAAAQAAVAALPPAVRTALGGWYRGRRWAAPARWSAQQWCEALQEAGKLTVAQDRAPQAGEPAAAAQEASPGGAWLDEALAKATGDTLTDKECRALWAESAGKVHAREITKADAKRVQDYLRARLADLAQEAREARVKATGLEDDDPWAVKILAMASREEAEGALAEIDGQRQATLIDAARATQLTAAIEACFPAPQEAVAA
jgi:hypothetical protein